MGGGQDDDDDSYATSSSSLDNEEEQVSTPSPKRPAGKKNKKWQTGKCKCDYLSKREFVSHGAFCSARCF